MAMAIQFPSLLHVTQMNNSQWKNKCLILTIRLQPNVETEEKRMEAWRTLVLDYCRNQKIYVLDVQEAMQSPLFSNKSISSQY